MVRRPARRATAVLAVVALAAGCTGASTGPAQEAGTTTPVATPSGPNPTTLPSPHQVVARTPAVPYGPAPAQVVDTYVPDASVPSATGDSDRRPAFVLVHGGGWTAGTRTSNHAIAAELASAGWVAITVGYRLAPAHAFPAPADDVRTALEWVHARSDDLGVDPDRVVIGGQSAGGHLSGLVALADERPPVAAWVSWSGAYDLGPLASRLEGTIHDELVASIGAHLGCDEPAGDACADRATTASPIERASADDPPTLLLHSTDEALPLVGAEEMRDALDAVGVRVELATREGSAHGLDLVPDTREEVGAFLADVLDLRR